MDHWLVEGRPTPLPLAQCVLSACLAQLLFLLMRFDPFGNIYFPRLCRHEQTEISKARWLVFVLPVYVKRYRTAKCLFAIGCWAGSQGRPDQTSCLRARGALLPVTSTLTGKYNSNKKCTSRNYLYYFARHCVAFCCVIFLDATTAAQQPLQSLE